MIDAIAALANRFWSIHPNEIPLGITREQYYEQEMRALFATQATARIEALEAAHDEAVANAARWEQRFNDDATMDIARARIELLEARLDRAVTRGLEQVEQIATLEAALRATASAIEALAFEMPPPNPYTPQFVMIANTARAALAPEQEK